MISFDKETHSKSFIISSAVEADLFIRFIVTYIIALNFLLSNICVCSCRAKSAIGAIKKKLNDKNPHVALYALEVRHVTTVFFVVLVLRVLS